MSGDVNIVAEVVAEAAAPDVCSKCEGRGYGDDGKICVCRRKQMLNDLLPPLLRPVPANQKLLNSMLNPELLVKLKSKNVVVDKVPLDEYHGLVKAFLAYRVNLSMQSVSFFEIDPSQLADVKYGEKRINNVMVSIDEIMAADLISLKLTWCTPNSTYEDLLMSLLSLRAQSGLTTWVWLDPTLQQDSKKFGDVFMSHIRHGEGFYRISKD